LTSRRTDGSRLSEARNSSAKIAGTIRAGGSTSVSAETATSDDPNPAYPRTRNAARMQSAT
jgi:hypothetical protein